MDIKNLTESFDEIISRFPHLCRAIFNQVDNSSLTNCRKVSETWKIFIDHEKFQWLRRIQSYKGIFEPFLDQWNKVIMQMPIEEFKELCLAIVNFFKLGSNMMSYNYSPLHIAAEIGLIEHSRRIIQITDYRNNNSYLPNFTPLHLAAENGHLEVCRLILENAASKNPVAFDGLTPLHSAARRGHKDIIKLLVANQVNIRPLFNGRTPLEYAAQRGHTFCCFFLIKNRQDLQQFWLTENIQYGNREFVPLPPPMI